MHLWELCKSCIMSIFLPWANTWSVTTIYLCLDVLRTWRLICSSLFAFCGQQHGFQRSFIVRAKHCQLLVLIRYCIVYGTWTTLVVAKVSILTVHLLIICFQFIVTTRWLISFSFFWLAVWSTRTGGTAVHKICQQVNWQRKDDGRVLLCGDRVKGLQNETMHYHWHVYHSGYNAPEGILTVERMKIRQ